MSSAEPASDVDRLVDQLEERAERVEQTRAELAEFGHERVAELADAHRSFTAVLERYEEQVVTDGGDVQTNVEFQSELDRVLKEIPQGVLLRETFTECTDALKKKWFNESDFEHVYELLEPVEDIVARLDDYETARDRFREASREAGHRLQELDSDISELERLVELGDADLDAPTERLREPIEAYNHIARESFETFFSEARAREVVSFLEVMRMYPLVAFETPPEEFRSYLQTAPIGEESVPRLLELADYSRSKLDHYVEDPDRFARVVGRHQTYLSGLSAEPLLVAWPPPPADRLRWRCRALTAALGRIDPDAVESLREVAALPRETDYERLRDSVLARSQLGDAERERLREGGIERDLERLRDQRDRLQAALDAHDPL